MLEVTATAAQRLGALLTEVEPENQPPWHSPVDLDDLVQNRSSIVLDALARVLVSSPRHEVIAVGYQTNHERATVTGFQWSCTRCDDQPCDKDRAKSATTW